MPKPFVVCPLLVAAVGLPAQATHFVGPGGFAQIRDAAAVAAPGDTILIAPGTYAHFTLPVGCTVRALTPGTVDVAYDLAFAAPGCPGGVGCLEGPTVIAPPVGQAAHVIGLHFLPNVVQPFPGPQLRHRVLVSSGRVTFDECELRALNTTVLTVDSASVHLQGCVVAAESGVGAVLTGHGLVASNAFVTAVDSTIAANPLQGGVLDPGDGIRLLSSTLHGSHLTIRGGRTTVIAPALRGDASTVWLSDSSLAAGWPTACDVVVNGGTVALDRCTFASTATGCATFPSPTSLLGVARPQPIQNGAVFSLQFRTAPNGFAAVFASPGLVDGVLPFLFEQPVWIDGAPLIDLGLWLADGTGLATASWVMPPGLYVGDLVWLQGVTGFALPFQTSPVVGGLVR